MALMQSMRSRAQRAWRAILAAPSPPADSPARGQPPRVDAVPLPNVPQRRARKTDAGPWLPTEPRRWQR